jgi:hypothetical protein
MAEHTLTGRTGDFVASVTLDSWEPDRICRGGPVVVRSASGDSGTIALRARWSDESGLTDFDRAVRVNSRLSNERLAALEVALHDAATVEIAISRVAREHRLTRSDAANVLDALIGREGPDAYEAVASRPHCLRSWLDPDNASQICGASGWVFWWEDSGACVSVAAGGAPVAHHEGVESLGEAIALAAGRIRCQCGEVTGTKCSHFRLRREMMCVEWVPYQRRRDFAGCYPENGALRLLCCVECGAMLVESEPDWAHMFLGE